MAQLTPNLVASGNIRPNRFVKSSGTNTGAECSAATDLPIGVTDQSVRDPSSSYNATSGTPIFLQQPKECWVYADDVTSITAGAKLSPGTTGGAVVYANNATNVPCAIALETPSANGVLFRIWLLDKTAPGA